MSTTRRRINHSARRADAARRLRNTTDDPATFNDSELSGAIYYLQTLNRQGFYSVRIRALLAEQQQRREVTR